MTRFKILFSLVVVCCLASFGMADTKQQHANRMAVVGMHHDPAAGRENVFYHSGNLGPVRARLAARAAWRASPGHRANLPMFGLRVGRSANGTFVVGR